MPAGFFNWHSGSLESTMVLTWDGVEQYKWVLGAKLVWPDGRSGTITDRSTLEGTAFEVPSGIPPICARGSVYNNSNLACQLCPEGTFQSGGALTSEVLGPNIEHGPNKKSD